MMRQPSIFLCHSGIDREFARHLARDLEEAGVKVWIDEAEIKLGDSLIEKIREGIDAVDYLAVILSPDSVNSIWVQKEVDIAMNQEIKGSKVKVLPLMYRRCELPWFLEGKFYANFTEHQLYQQALCMVLDRLNLIKGTSIISNNLQHEVGVDNSDRIKILFLGANPETTSRLKLDEEVKRIKLNLMLAKERNTLELISEWAITIDTLMQVLLDESPNIIHFSGHGQQEGITLQDEIGKPKIVSTEALASLFNLFKESVRCIVLNSCYSEHQAKCIKQYIPYVIGMRLGITDKAAIAFSTGFYKAIGAGREIPFAFELGVAAIKLEGVSGDDIPILL